MISYRGFTITLRKAVRRNDYKAYVYSENHDVDGFVVESPIPDSSREFVEELAKARIDAMIAARGGAGDEKRDGGEG